MTKSKGFTFVEILLSLILIISTSLALLRQLWQLNQTLNQRLVEAKIFSEIINQNEQST